MHHFAYRDDILHAEDVSLEAIADAVGTPFYAYSRATLLRHYDVLARALADLNPLIAYSVKASPNIALIALLARRGAGADVVSGGELMRALKAGVPPGRIVFSGVGKTREEMRLALEAGIHQFNVESEGELGALNEVALAMGAVAPIAFRINPDVKAGGHEKISTGKAEDKFGVPIARARAIYGAAARLQGVAVKGVDLHIGSQISDLDPFRIAFSRVAELVMDLRADGHAIERLDVGGGLAVPYGNNGDPPHPEQYAAVVREIAAPQGLRLIIEPGRLIAANAGVLVSRVLYVKEGAARRILVIDAGMNDLIRPAFYDAYHAIEPARRKPGPTSPCDVVGPVCESSDRFAKDRPLPELGAGDLLAFMTAGAYGASQASEYNSRPLVPEVLVAGARFDVIRRRPTFDEMIARESLPPS
ncbi:MAG: diaminopimelate decarboxylase [Parvularculaceae bacterium]|nr:diaminopimelate decarboxylase [Parvularculaceae bacterium]